MLKRKQFQVPLNFQELNRLTNRKISWKTENVNLLFTWKILILIMYLHENSLVFTNQPNNNGEKDHCFLQ